MKTAAYFKYKELVKLKKKEVDDLFLGPSKAEVEEARRRERRELRRAKRFREQHVWRSVRMNNKGVTYTKRRKSEELGKLSIETFMKRRKPVKFSKIYLKNFEKSVTKEERAKQEEVTDFYLSNKPLKFEADKIVLEKLDSQIEEIRTFNDMFETFLRETDAELTYLTQQLNRIKSRKVDP